MSVKIETRWKRQLNNRDRRTRQKQINIYTIKDPLLNLEFISRKFLKKKGVSSKSEPKKYKSQNTKYEPTKYK